LFFEKALRSDPIVQFRALDHLLQMRDFSEVVMGWGRLFVSTNAFFHKCMFLQMHDFSEVVIWWGRLSFLPIFDRLFSRRVAQRFIFIKPKP